MKLRYSETALRELDEIFAYISDRNRFAMMVEHELDWPPQARCSRLKREAVFEGPLLTGKAANVALAIGRTAMGGVLVAVFVAALSHAIIPKPEAPLEFKRVFVE